VIATQPFPSKDLRFQSHYLRTVVAYLAVVA
jgi:hypothetical protein